MNRFTKKHIYAVLCFFFYLGAPLLCAQESGDVLVLNASDLHIDSLRNFKYHHYKITGVLHQSSLSLFQKAIGGASNSFINTVDFSEAVIEDSISFSHVFNKYSGLTSITLPLQGRSYISNMKGTFWGTRIESLDLKGCTSIRDISDICRAAPKVQKIDLSDCSRIEDMTLSFLSASSLKEVIMPQTAPNLSSLIHAFYGTKVEKIVLPSLVNTNCNMSHAFVSCLQLQSIILPLNQTHLYNGMFHSCPKLTEIIYAGDNFLQSNEYQFESSASSEKSTTKFKEITFWVKIENLRYYITDPVWGALKNILPIQTSGLEADSTLPFSISYNNGIITVNSDEECELNIYSTSGLLLQKQNLNKGDNNIQLFTPKIYILQIQSKNKQKNYISKITI